MPNTFTWNGQSSADFGIYIENRHTMNRSQRKFEATSVHGRNGNIYEMQNAWEEVIVSYDIFVGDETSADIVAPYTDIMEWLNSADGYAELTDTYDPDHYRQAVFVDAVTIEPVNTHSNWYALGQATISFRCRPERYIVMNPLTPSSGGIITNNTNHTAEPVITLTGAGARSLVNLEGRSIVYPYSASSPISVATAQELIPYQSTGFFAIKPSGGMQQIPFGNNIGSIVSAVNSTGTLSYNISGASTKDWGMSFLVPVDSNSKYTLSFEAYEYVFAGVVTADKSGTNAFSGQYSRQTNYTANTWKTVTLTFTTGETIGYALIWFSMHTPSAVSVGTTRTIRKLMFNKGDTAIPFRPYDDNIVSNITIRNTVLSMNGSFNTAVIDCEKEDVQMDGVSSNRLVAVRDQYGNLSAEYLNLTKGNNSISFDGEIASVSVDPRFWEL